MKQAPLSQLMSSVTFKPGSGCGAALTALASGASHRVSDGRSAGTGSSSRDLRRICTAQPSGCGSVAGASRSGGGCVNDPVRGRARDRLVELWSGFACALVGFLAAVWLFAYVGLFTGGADPGDNVAVGLFVALGVGAIPAVVVPVVVLRARRRRPARAVGHSIGWTVGVAMLVLLTVTVYPVLDDLPGSCPCEAPFKQLIPGAP